jgi:mono/diheme cytochrome c family protein
MKKTVFAVIVALAISSMFLVACGGGGGGGGAGSGLKRQNPPADYANAKNPFEGNTTAVTAGKAVFEANCVPCHGQDAKGDGPAGASLNPKPANLQLTVKETNPQYQHWVVNVGGAAAGLSAQMPAFKGVLSDEDTWRVVTYLDQTYGGK